jgi:hypothetical protein
MAVWAFQILDFGSRHWRSIVWLTAEYAEFSILDVATVNVQPELL